MKRGITILLLLALCLSLFGCGVSGGNDRSSKKQSSSSKKPTSSSSQQSNNPSNTPQIDPNGFSSLEQYIDSYIAFQTTYTLTRELFWKMMPEKIWEEVYNFESQWANYVQYQEKNRTTMESKYGNNFEITYEIIDSEILDKSKYKEYLELFDAKTEIVFYNITISTTIKGEYGEFTRKAIVPCQKIENKWYWLWSY